MTGKQIGMKQRETVNSVIFGGGGGGYLSENVTPLEALFWIANIWS